LYAVEEVVLNFQAKAEAKRLQSGGWPAWNFHQIHPINFHCVVDGHHKSATLGFAEFD
jgi:hypothetical protein